MPYSDETKTGYDRIIAKYDTLTITFANAINITSFSFNTSPLERDAVTSRAFDIAICSMMKKYLDQGGRRDKLTDCLHDIARLGESELHLAAIDCPTPADFGAGVDYGNDTLNALLRRRSDR